MYPVEPIGGGTAPSQIYGASSRQRCGNDGQRKRVAHMPTATTTKEDYFLSKGSRLIASTEGFFHVGVARYCCRRCPGCVRILCMALCKTAAQGIDRDDEKDSTRLLGPASAGAIRPIGRAASPVRRRPNCRTASPPLDEENADRLAGSGGE